jgi:hypothetical protein
VHDFTKARPSYSVQAVYALTGTAFQKAPTFPVGSITTGPVTLVGVLFVAAPTFPQGTVFTGTIGGPVPDPQAVWIGPEGELISVGIEGKASMNGQEAQAVAVGVEGKAVWA